MTKRKEITCIVCPIGCKILIESDGKKFKLISGNRCKRGVDYARSEALNPERMLTSSILVENGIWPLVSVKSSKPIQKEMIFSVLKEIKRKKVAAPIQVGQILIRNVSGTSIDILATKSIEEIKK